MSGSPDPNLVNISRHEPVKIEYDSLDPNQGTVYLIHYDSPMSHAQHYLGWALDHMDRVNDHLAGHGAKITRAFVAAGIVGELVRTWSGGRTKERELKDKKNARGLCPKCLPAYNDEAAARMRRYRSRP